MFNRSWYKNTWLGKKLGFKIDWSKENLVHKRSSVDFVKVIHGLEDGAYIGFTSGGVRGLNSDKTTYSYISTSKIIECDIDLEKYDVMYDSSKVLVNKRIKELEIEDTKSNSSLSDNVYIVVKSGMEEKEAHEYMFSVMFLREASKYILGVEVSPIVRLKWGVRLICAGKDASKLRMLISKHIK